MGRASARNFSLRSRWISVEKTRWFTVHTNAQYCNKTHIYPNTFPWIYYTGYAKKNTVTIIYRFLLRSMPFFRRTTRYFSTYTDGLFRSKPDVYKWPPPSAFKKIALVFTNRYRAPVRGTCVPVPPPPPGIAASGEPWPPFASWTVHLIGLCRVYSKFKLSRRLSYNTYHTIVSNKLYRLYITNE